MFFQVLGIKKYTYVGRSILNAPSFIKIMISRNNKTLIPVNDVEPKIISK